jgi:hypothetical protein
LAGSLYRVGLIQVLLHRHEFRGWIGRDRHFLVSVL